MLHFHHFDIPRPPSSFSLQIFRVEWSGCHDVCLERSKSRFLSDLVLFCYNHHSKSLEGSKITWRHPSPQSPVVVCMVKIWYEDENNFNFMEAFRFCAFTSVTCIRCSPWEISKFTWMFTVWALNRLDIHFLFPGPYFLPLLLGLLFVLKMANGNVFLSLFSLWPFVLPIYYTNCTDIVWRIGL